MLNHPLHDTEFVGRQGRRNRLPCLVDMHVAAVATVVIALLTLHDPCIRPARAGDEGPIGKTHAPAAAAAKRAFVREIHRSLKRIDDRLGALAKRVLEVPGYGARLGDRLVNMRIEEKSAEANYLNARLTREVAEIGILEYKEANLVQDGLTLEGEIKLAESDLMRARDIVEYADQVAARDAVKLWTRLNEQGKALRLEAAEMKKKALREYTAPRRIKELESDVARARSDEQAKAAEWARLQRRLEKIEKAITADRGRSDVEQPSLARLVRAIQIDEQVHAKLDQFVKMANSDDSLQKEIRDLANELGTVADEAEAVNAADEFARLKLRIRETARRQGAAVQK